MSRQMHCLKVLGLCVCLLLQAHINSPEALAAAAAAAAAAAEAETAPLHEENEWGIEVCADDTPAAADTAAAAGGTAAAEALPEGLQFAMPTSGVDAAVLKEEAVQPTEASLDELTNMLSSLNK